MLWRAAAGHRIWGVSRNYSLGAISRRYLLWFTNTAPAITAIVPLGPDRDADRNSRFDSPQMQAVLVGEARPDLSGPLLGLRCARSCTNANQGERFTHRLCHDDRDLVGHRGHHRLARPGSGSGVRIKCQGLSQLLAAYNCTRSLALTRWPCGRGPRRRGHRLGLRRRRYSRTRCSPRLPVGRGGMVPGWDAPYCSV